MRTKKQIFMLLLALLVGIPTLSAQSKKEKKEQKKEAVKKLIESENYKIDVNTAMPMRGRSIPLTSSYSLEIRNDSVISYLPYYGRAYSILNAKITLINQTVCISDVTKDSFRCIVMLRKNYGVYTVICYRIS